MKYKIVSTGRFRRDCKKYGYLLKNGEFKKPLKTALDILADGGMLDITYEDHKLSGQWKGCREFHVEFDLVCIYKIDQRKLIVETLRLATHHEVFGSEDFA